MLRKEGFSGATVLRGVAGFGGSSVVHNRQQSCVSRKIFPIVIEVIEVAGTHRVHSSAPRRNDRGRPDHPGKSSRHSPIAPPKEMSTPCRRQLLKFVAACLQTRSLLCGLQSPSLNPSTKNAKVPLAKKDPPWNHRPKKSAGSTAASLGVGPNLPLLRLGTHETATSVPPCIPRRHRRRSPRGSAPSRASPDGLSSFLQALGRPLHVNRPAKKRKPLVLAGLRHHRAGHRQFSPSPPKPTTFSSVESSRGSAAGVRSPSKKSHPSRRRFRPEAYGRAFGLRAP